MRGIFRKEREDYKSVIFIFRIWRSKPRLKLEMLILLKDLSRSINKQHCKLNLVISLPVFYLLQFYNVEGSRKWINIQWFFYFFILIQLYVIVTNWYCLVSFTIESKLKFSLSTSCDNWILKFIYILKKNK